MLQESGYLLTAGHLLVADVLQKGWRDKGMIPNYGKCDTSRLWILIFLCLCNRYGLLSLVSEYRLILSIFYD